jgi:hypothetical protein
MHRGVTVSSVEKANRERLKNLHDELPRFIAWVEFHGVSDRGKPASGVR